MVAERVRREVISLCDQWLAQNESSAPTSTEGQRECDTRYWALATRAEALFALDDPTASRSLDAAFAVAPVAWMADSTKEQIKQLQVLLSPSPLRYLEAAT